MNLRNANGRLLPWRSRTRSLTGAAWRLMPDPGTGDDPIGFFLFVICLPLLIPAVLITPVWLVESVAQWTVLPFVLLYRMCRPAPIAQTPARPAISLEK